MTLPQVFPNLREVSGRWPLRRTDVTIGQRPCESSKIEEDGCGYGVEQTSRVFDLVYSNSTGFLLHAETTYRWHFDNGAERVNW
jgi:hypothetical protein